MVALIDQVMKILGESARYPSWHVFSGGSGKCCLDSGLSRHAW